jgi:hypothetical protein
MIRLMQPWALAVNAKRGSATANHAKNFDRREHSEDHHASHRNRISTETGLLPKAEDFP